MQKLSRELASDGKRIGLVPTMGFLHDGHLLLIKRAKKQSDITITTIFVNPTQFAPTEDLAKYPRDEKGDIAKIKAGGGDIIFIPRTDEIYADQFQTYVNVEKITQFLEGRHRPEHFKGVTTIVAKLFNIIRPDLAVFGQKDYQQAAVIKRMVRDLDYPIRIIVAPTIRDKDGLALSSRNKYFSYEQRQEAVCLYKALKEAKETIKINPNIKPTQVKTAMMRVIKKICSSAEIDYMAFTDYETLEEISKFDKNSICSLAVNLHGVRLIDNMKIG